MTYLLRHRSTLPILILISLLLGCGDETGEREPAPDVDCPRLELESLEDCTYEEEIYLNDSGTVDAFCESACNTVSNFVAYGPGGGLLNLRDLEFMRGVVEIEQGFRIEHMENLETLEGLNSLRHSGNGLVLYSNQRLRNLEALGSLETVATAPRAQADFDINTNPKLETLAGLESLREVGTTLAIRDNDNLRSIEALESLEKVQYLWITNNPKLPTCQAEALAERIEVTGSVTIRGNGTGSCD